MCQKMGAPEHADMLMRALDRRGDGEVTFQDFCEGWDAVRITRVSARLKFWHRCLGLGVAGNVAGHMEQAGEADPAAHKADKKASTPAAIFAFYAPQAENVGERFLPDGSSDGCDAVNPKTPAAARQQRRRLGPQDGWQFPVTNAVIDFPHLEGASKVQVEPEIALLADIVYAPCGGKVERLVPRKVAAFNDCSIRQLDGAEKLSEKKNWGFGSKGISLETFRVRSFKKGSLVDYLVLVSYVKRGGQIHQYSISAPARNYCMFHEPLLEWIVERMNNQKDEGKWENVSELLEACDHPTSVWIALGAGEYTTWGNENYLQPRDECLVVVYDEREFPGGPSEDKIRALFNDQEPPEGIISLHQTFV